MHRGSSGSQQASRYGLRLPVNYTSVTALQLHQHFYQLQDLQQAMLKMQQLRYSQQQHTLEFHSHTTQLPTH
jgi:hypothetical protein